jgi:hypothetical protein
VVVNLADDLGQALSHYGSRLDCDILVANPTKEVVMPWTTTPTDAIRFEPKDVDIDIRRGRLHIDSKDLPKVIAALTKFVVALLGFGLLVLGGVIVAFIRNPDQWYEGLALVVGIVLCVTGVIMAMALLIPNAPVIKAVFKGVADIVKHIVSPFVEPKDEQGDQQQQQGQQGQQGQQPSPPLPSPAPSPGPPGR